MESLFIPNNSIQLGFNHTFKCQDVNNLARIDLQCQFIRSVSDCVDENALFNYLELAYCSGLSRLTTTAVLLVWLSFLFIAIGITADDFLCPVLITISKSLKLSDNIAGVTFLAFGNGAPDIFSSIIGVNEDDSSLVIGELFGAGIFVTTVVVGSILLRTDFTIMKRPLLRDISFYLITTCLVWFILYNGSMHLYNSLLYIGIYIIYVCVVVLSGYLYKINRQNAQTATNLARRMPNDRLEGKKKYRMPELEPEENSRKGKITLKTILSTNNKPQDDEEGVVLQRIIFRKYHPNPMRQRRFTLYHITENNTQPPPAVEDKLTNVYTLQLDANNNDTSGDKQHSKVIDMTELNTRRVTLSDANFTLNTNKTTTSTKPNYSPLHVLESIREYFLAWDGPSKGKEVSRIDCKFVGRMILDASNIEWSEFVQSSFIAKVMAVMKAPVYIVLTVTIPVVDTDLPLQGWHRGLALSQCLISPHVCLILTGMTLSAPMLCHSLALCVSVLMVVPLIALTSRPDRPPSYHVCFAYIGFIISVIVIYTIAHEVVDILQSIGVIFSISKFLLGLTVLAWGNSIGDFISNLSMARNGFPRMAISACFGGPVLNMLLGIGVPYTYLLVKKYQNGGGLISLEYSKWVTILYTTITVSLVSTIFFLVVITHFRSNRLHAVWLYVIYAFFLTACLLAEMNIL